MEKILRIGKGSKGNIFIKAEINKNNVLSISGVIGPLKNGNAIGGCGQIDMEFQHRHEKDNDKRYSHPTKPEDIEFAPGWDKEKWFDLLDVWKRWHLNNLHAECEHQRELGWTYEEHHDPKTFKGELCPVCGYSIGSKWLKEDLPQSVIDFINSLPDTDIQPNWI